MEKEEELYESWRRRYVAGGWRRIVKKNEVVQQVEGRVVEPGVLDELVLPGEVRVQAREVQAALVAVGVVPAAAQDAVAVVDGERPLGPRARWQRVAGVGPADVRADRAGQAVGVERVV